MRGNTAMATDQPSTVKNACIVEIHILDLVEQDIATEFAKSALIQFAGAERQQTEPALTGL